MKRELKRKLKTFLMVSLLVIWCTSVAVAQQYKDGVLQGTVRIKIKPSLAQAISINKSASTGIISTGITQLDALNTAYAATEMKRVFRYSPKFEEKHIQYGLNLWYEVSINPTISTTDAVNAYSQLVEIEKAEPIREKIIIDGSNAPIYVTKPAMAKGLEYFNDPYLSQQWHYNNTGQSGGTPGADINAYKAWDISKGSKNVIVSIHDMGVDVDHEDLKDAMWVNKLELTGTAGVDDDGNGYKDDIYGFNFAKNIGAIDAGFHGTHVAGTIGAVNNNGIGVAGIAGGSGTANGVRLMSCQILGGAGMGNTPDSYIYAADMGAVISQNSWGYYDPYNYEQSVLDAIDYFIAEAGNYPSSPMKGGIVIFAAGNSAWEYPSYPAYYESCIAVGALNASSNVTVYSNYGTWVDISAPGGQSEDDANIDPNSEFKNGVLSTLENDAYGYMDGTSMACPHVSGVAALVVSKFGSTKFTNTELKNRLLTGTRFIDTIPGNEYYVGKMGSGAIDGVLALATDTKQAPNKITNLSLTGIAQDFATIAWTVPADNDDAKPVKFEVAYSTQPISAATIQLAKIIKLNNVLNAGETNSLEIAYLKPTTTYFFNVRSIDRWGNISEFSNSASGNTNAGPDAMIDPTTPQLELMVDVSVNPNQSASFNLLNNGEGLLKWTASTNHQNATPSSIKQVNFPEIKKQHVSNQVKIISSYVGKTANATSYSIDQPTYEYMSYLNPESWDLVVLGDNDTTYTNSSATRFYVDSVSGFNLTQVQAFLVHKESSGPIILEVYEGEAIADAKIVYNQEVNYSADYGYTGIVLDEQVFFEQGKYFWIVLHVPSMNKFPLGAGLETQKSDSKNCFYSSDLGKSWNMLEDVYYDNQLVWAVYAVSQYKNLGDYLTHLPDAGTVEPKNQTSINVSVDGLNMVNGTYSATVVINTNETLEPMLRLPVRVTIDGHKPVIKSEPLVDAGGVLLGNEKLIEVKLRNEGLALFQFSDFGVDENWNSIYFQLSNPQFEYVSGLNTWFESGTEQTLTFKLKPEQLGNISSTVKMHDIKGNTYTFSLFGYGIDPPVLEILPDQANYKNLSIGDEIKGSFEIKNQGSYPLDYFLPAFADGSNMAEVPANTHKFGYTSAINSEVATNSPAYNWTDISSSGTDVTAYLSNNENPFYQVSLGFPFPYFGKNETAVYISQYSTLSFDIEGYIWSRNPLNYKWEGLPDRIISVLGIKSFVEKSGRIYFKRYSNKFIVQWDNVAIGGIAKASYQAVLHDNGNINIYIKNIDLENFSLESVAMSSYMGIEDQTKNDGILINDFSAINLDALKNCSAIEFVCPGQGLYTTINTPFGSVQPGESVTIDYTINTDSLCVAQYIEKISVITNDPINSTGLFTTNFEITQGGSPSVLLSNSELNFGEVFKNDTKSISIYMGNTGKAPTTIETASFSNGYYTIDGSFPMVLKPGMALFYDITQVSSTVGAFTDKLIFTTSEPKTYEVDLKGEVIESPEIASNISEINETLSAGQFKTLSLEISNHGMTDLDFAPVGNSWMSVTEKQTAKQVPTLPDYSYRFLTSNSNGGPKFNWVEIADPENKITVGEIWNGESPWSEKIELPFDFNFYGTEYNYVYVGYNGIISFTENQELNPFGGSSAIPDVAAPNNFIAPIYGFIGQSWLELYPLTGYYCNIEDDRITIEFKDFNTGFAMTGPMSIQAILFKNGNIKFQYKMLNKDDADLITPFGVIGVENADGTAGLQIANRSYDDRDELAYEIFPVKKYVVQAGASKLFDIKLDASELFADTYTDNLQLLNNAPLAQNLSIPVTLNVSGEAILTQPGMVNYGDMLVYETETPWGGYDFATYEKLFEINNNGTAKAEILQFDNSKMTSSTAYAYTLTQGWFGNWVYDWIDVSTLPQYNWETNQTMPVYVQPKTVMQFKVLAKPTIAGQITDTLSLITDKGIIEIPIRGESFMPPVISTPDTVKVYADVKNYTEQQHIVIDNTNGGYKLNYTLAIDFMRDEETKSQSNSSNSNSKSVAPQLLTKKLEKPSKKSSNSKADFNRELSYENHTAAETGLGFGGAAPFYSATTFKAPDNGFNLTHVQTWYIPGTWLKSKIKVQIYAGNNNINLATLVHSQTYEYNISEANAAGELLTIELDKNLVFYPNEVFFVVFGYESGAAYPQGVGAINPPVQNRYNYSSGNGQWSDIYNAGQALQSFAWIVRALEAEYQSSVWVSLASDDTSSITAASNGSISIDFNANFALPGFNNANLVITSNDPLQPKKIVALQLHLNKGPEMDISGAGLTVNENEKVNFQVAATDIEGDNFTMTLKTGPEFVSYTVLNNTMNVNCAPTFNDAGQHNIVIEAVDVKGNKSETTVLLTVKNVNRAPYVIDPIDDFGIISTDLHNLNLATVITDDDDEALVYNVTCTDESIVKLYLSSDAVIFAPISAGVVTITITGTDAAGLSATHSFNVTAWGVGIDGDLTDSIHLYPTPANEEVTLLLPHNLKEGSTLKITNLIGVVLFEQKIEKKTTEHKLNISSFADGIYLVKIENDGFEKTLHIIKN